MANDIHYYTAPWCMPCKALKPKVKGLADELGVKFVEHDADSEPLPTGAMSVPAIVIGGQLVNVNGQPWTTTKNLLTFAVTDQA